MGRGAGNVKTESLLRKFKFANYKPSSINNISRKYFLNLKKDINGVNQIIIKLQLILIYIQLIFKCLKQIKDTPQLKK